MDTSSITIADVAATYIQHAYAGVVSTDYRMEDCHAGRYDASQLDLDGIQGRVDCAQRVSCLGNFNRLCR